MKTRPLHDLPAAYRGMLPWLLLTWLVAGFLPGPAGQQALLNVGVCPFIVAAAARGLGLHPDRNVPTLAIERAFTHLTSLLPLLLFAGLAAAIGGTIGAMIADGLGLHDPRPTAFPLAALAALPILWWHWPAAVLAFVVPDHPAFRPPGRRAWRGPGYGDAHRLARHAGRPAPTALILALLLLWIAFLAVGAGSTGPVPRTLVDASSYLLFLPLLVALAVAEVRCMVAAAEHP